MFLSLVILVYFYVLFDLIQLSSPADTWEQENNQMDTSTQ